MFCILTSGPSDSHILSWSFIFMWFHGDNEMPSNSDSTGPMKHCSHAGHLFFFSFEIQNVNTFISACGENCVLHNLLLWVEEWGLTHWMKMRKHLHCSLCPHHFQGDIVAPSSETWNNLTPWNLGYFVTCFGQEDAGKMLCSTPPLSFPAKAWRGPAQFYPLGSLPQPCDLAQAGPQEREPRWLNHGRSRSLQPEGS